MIEWVIIVGLAVAMYILIYKYEKKMDTLHNMVAENRKKLEDHDGKITKNREHIDHNHSRLNEHNSYIERMWVTLPKCKDGDDKID